MHPSQTPSVTPPSSSVKVGRRRLSPVIMPTTQSDEDDDVAFWKSIGVVKDPVSVSNKSKKSKKSKK
jgi:hypothetical protein